MRKVLVVMLVAAGCASSAPSDRGGSARAGPGAGPEVASTPQAPLTVEWLLKGENAGTLTLVARVNRHAPMRVPVTVTISLPPGVQLVSGKQSWVIEPSSSVEPVDETVVVRVLQSGPRELLLAADAEGPSFGIHAKKAYPLGSSGAPARSAAPTPSGPDLRVGDHDYGPSVPAKP